MPRAAVAYTNGATTPPAQDAFATPAISAAFTLLFFNAIVAISVVWLSRIVCSSRNWPTKVFATLEVELARGLSHRRQPQDRFGRACIGSKLSDRRFLMTPKGLAHLWFLRSGEASPNMLGKSHEDMEI